MCMAHSLCPTVGYKALMANASSSTCTVNSSIRISKELTYLSAYLLTNLLAEWTLSYIKQYDQFDNITLSHAPNHPATPHIIAPRYITKKASTPPIFIQRRQEQLPRVE